MLDLGFGICISVTRGGKLSYCVSIFAEIMGGISENLDSQDDSSIEQTDCDNDDMISNKYIDIILP